MVFFIGGKVIDYDLDLLRELLQLLDAQLDRLDKWAAQADDADGEGIYDSTEHVVGLGFVAAQTYLAATYGAMLVKKQKALGFGPPHRSGYTIAQLVNHAANYWKHRDEWPLTPNAKPQVETLAALSAMGVDVSGSYPLGNVLAKLVLRPTGRFNALTSHLEAWRDALIRDSKQSGSSTPTKFMP